MSLFFVPLLILCLFGFKADFKNGFPDYMSQQKTGAVKGIFVIIVFLSHSMQYTELSGGFLDVSFRWAMSILSQLMVVMFLFYSGYGIALSLEKKPGYVKTIPAKRFFRVWYHFALTIPVFYAVGLLVGKSYGVKRLLLSFVGVSGVGNSNWFVFDILLLYALTFFVFIFAKEKLFAGTAVLTVLCVASVGVLYYFKRGSYWWYDTLLCYPLGMWYYIFKEKTDAFLFKSTKNRIAALSVNLILFSCLAVLLEICGKTRKIFIPEALVFALLVVLFTVNFSVNNRVLRFFGKHVFSVYILQRIPMIIMKRAGLSSQPLLFTLFCFVLTVGLAVGYDCLLEKTDVLLHLSQPRANCVASHD